MNSNSDGDRMLAEESIRMMGELALCGSASGCSRQMWSQLARERSYLVFFRMGPSIVYACLKATERRANFKLFIYLHVLVVSVVLSCGRYFNPF